MKLCNKLQRLGLLRLLRFHHTSVFRLTGCCLFLSHLPAMIQVCESEIPALSVGGNRAWLLTQSSWSECARVFVRLVSYLVCQFVYVVFIDFICAMSTL